MMYSSSRNWKVKQLWEDFSGIRIEWEHTGNTTDFHFWYGSNPLYDIFGWMNIHKRKLLPRFSDTLELFGARDYPSTILEVEPTRIQTCLEHIHCGDRELRYSSQWPLGCVPKFSTHLHIGSRIYIYIYITTWFWFIFCIQPSTFWYILTNLGMAQKYGASFHPIPIFRSATGHLFQINEFSYRFFLVATLPSIETLENWKSNFKNMIKSCPYYSL